MKAQTIEELNQLLYGKDAPEVLEGVEMPQARETVSASEKRAPATAQAHHGPTQSELPLDDGDVLAAERMRAVENWADTMELLKTACDEKGFDLTVYEKAMIAVQLTQATMRRFTSEKIGSRKY